MPFKQYHIHNISLFFRVGMINQTNASVTPTIMQRKSAETVAVNALIAFYLGLFTLFMWFEQFRMPYVHLENIEFYWEVLKVSPFSDAEKAYRPLFLAEIERIYIWQWALFILIPLVSLSVFFIARSKLKNMQMHEASSGGKLATLGRVMALFIEGKAQFLMLFVIGYSFFATAAFSQWMIDASKGSADFNFFNLFFPIGALVLVWQFIRPFATYYVITIHKK